jgi:hypothetical protein
MATEFKTDTIAEEKVITFPPGVDYIHTQISLDPGATDYRAIDALNSFPVFSVQFDTIIRAPLAANGSAILWHSQLIASQGRWWNVFVVENQSDVAVSVIVKTKNV